MSVHSLETEQVVGNMRLFFAMGPGDTVQDARSSRGLTDSQHDKPRHGETSITFSGQLIRLLEKRGHNALLVSSHSRADELQIGAIRLINLPRKLDGARGLAFYWSRIAYAWRLANLARRSGADFAIIDSGTTNFFALWTFRRYGIPVAVNFHNVRWAQGFAPTHGVSRIVRALDSYFFRHGALAALGCSPACADQARIDGADALPFYGWTAQYSGKGFPAPSAALNCQADPLRLVFVGRVEVNKGVFDLIDIARGLREHGLGDAHITVCGNGTALDAFRDAVAASSVADMITIRGRLERAELLVAYAASSLVIVPTRSDFTEGMPLVCAEAMLALRPVLASRVTNAIPVLGAAMLEAIPDDPASYVAQIVRFASDPLLRAELGQAILAAREQFLDRRLSYAAAIDAMLGDVGHQQQMPLDYAALFPEDGSEQEPAFAPALKPVFEGGA
jgi:glycogen(starch) synthase